MYIVHILRMQEYNLQLCAIFISGFLGVLTIKCPVCVIRAPLGWPERNAYSASHILFFHLSSLTIVYTPKPLQSIACLIATIVQKQ